MDPTNKVLYEFTNFIESNKLTVLFLTYQKNNFYLNKSATEIIDFSKLLANFDIFSKCFTEILKKNKSFALNIMNLFEYLSTIYYIKGDYLRSYNSLEFSTKFRDTHISPDIMQKYTICKLMNIYNRTECIVTDLRGECVLTNTQNALMECKQILDQIDFRFIQSFLDRILFLYYEQLISFYLNRMQDFEKFVGFFKSEINNYNYMKVKEELPVPYLKDFIELKSALLEINYLEKGQQNRTNDVLAICKQLRYMNIKANNEFFIKISIKMADIYFILKDTSNSIKILFSVVMLLKMLKQLPKDFKAKYRYLIYSKLSALYLFLKKEKDYNLYIDKFNKNSGYIRKNNILLAGNSFNNIQIAAMNNNAVFEMKNMVHCFN